MLLFLNFLKSSFSTLVFRQALVVVPKWGALNGSLKGYFFFLNVFKSSFSTTVFGQALALTVWVAQNKGGKERVSFPATTADRAADERGGKKEKEGEGEAHVRNGWQYII